MSERIYSTASQPSSSCRLIPGDGVVAIRAGCTKREIDGLLLHTYVYAGVYASFSSFLAAKEVFKEFEAERAGAKKAKARLKR